MISPRYESLKEVLISSTVANWLLSMTTRKCKGSALAIVHMLGITQGAYFYEKSRWEMLRKSAPVLKMFSFKLLLTNLANYKFGNPTRQT